MNLCVVAVLLFNRPNWLDTSETPCLHLIGVQVGESVVGRLVDCLVVEDMVTVGEGASFYILEKRTLLVLVLRFLFQIYYYLVFTCPDNLTWIPSFIKEPKARASAKAQSIVLFSTMSIRAYVDIVTLRWFSYCLWMSIYCSLSGSAPWRGVSWNRGRSGGLGRSVCQCELKMNS